MPDGPKLRLRVGSTRFDVSTDDPIWHDTLAQLWEPFISDDDGAPSRIDVRRLERGWRVTTPDLTRDGEDPWALADEIRHAVVQEALDSIRPDFIDLHAAALVVDGRTVLLAGPSRSGKTRLVLELVSRGWSYLSDDVALIQPATGDIHAFPKPIGIRSVEIWTSYAHRWRPPPWPTPPRGTLLLPASVLGRHEPHAAPPGLVAFSRFDPDAAATFTRVSDADAITRCGRFTRTMDARALQAFTRLCRSADVGEMTYSHAEDGVNLLIKRLSEVSSVG